MTGRAAAAIVVLMVAGAALACGDRGEQAPVNEYGNPEKLAPSPTDADITEADLRTRLYIFADDSMMGRAAGREGNMKGTAYIARELERLGIEPGGENGTYFQALPFIVRKYKPSSTFTVAGEPLEWGIDYVPVPGVAAPGPMDNVQVIYGGIAGDTTATITPAQAAGKLVVLAAAPAGQRGARGGGGGRGGRGRGGFGANARFAGAAGIATVDLDDVSPGARAMINSPAGRLDNRDAGAEAPPPGPATLRITSGAVGKLFGRPAAELAAGDTGRTVTAKLEFEETPVPDFARNVIGIIRGGDPALASEYVAIGAHNDHVGYTANPVDHDSARAFASAELQKRIVGGELTNPTPDERSTIHVNIDSLHAIRPARMDSINNGADDDGSGSMAVLEIAEAFAKADTKPRRSIIFVWHTGEETGLQGSRWFTDHPTVPRDSIVAQINIDMIGRGRDTDIPGGGENYLGVVGSKRLSTELGQEVIAVNERQPQPLQLDYRFDEPTEWPGYNNIYGRSDHANYARYNIPIAFFFTGLHQDYHRVTDEPQYIDYPHYTRITRYIRDLVGDVANRDRRPAVDVVAPEGGR